MRRAWAWCLILAALQAMPLRAATEGERLTALCRVWAAVRFLDPNVVFGDVDWDAALVRAIPKARAAQKDEELARAVGSMLAELHDPATRVFGPNEPRPAGVPLFRRDGDVLVINAGPYGAAHELMWTEMGPVAAELSKSKAVVVDLHFHGGDRDTTETIDYSVSTLAFAGSEVTAPANEFVVRSGYPPEDGSSSGGFYTALLSTAGLTFPAASGAAPERVAFVTDSRSPLPEVAVALQKAGKAAIFSADALAPARTRSISIAGPWRAALRVSRLHGAFAADLVSGDPMADAMAFARGEMTLPPPAAARPQIEPRARPAESHAEMTYPGVEHRILAAFRLWSVVDTFYPYKPLIGDWSAVLPELLPRFIAAKDADEYAAAVLEMAARIEDGHTRVDGPPSVARVSGEIGPPVSVRLVENQFVVNRATGGAAALLHPGDVVVSVDGEPFRARAERFRKFVTASTESQRLNRLAFAAMRGPQGSEAVLEVKGADGAVRSVRVLRAPSPRPPAADPPYRVMGGNVGYVDLRRLTPAQVDAMFDALMNTKAIIFDMRGYPNGTGWHIAARLNTRHAKVGAIFRRPEITGLSPFDQTASSFVFEQPLPDSDKPKYAGKTVMLIDDRAQSQSETTALWFEAANGTTFIGSPTGGANGDTTRLILPGGVQVEFSCHDVRHGDGRQLQRVGIQPHIAVEPTIRGLREGRDEVLDRAVAYLDALGH